MISPNLTAITISGTNMNGAKNFNISSYVEDWRSLTVNNFGFRGVTAESFNENGATSAYRQYASVSIQAYDNTTGTLTLNCSQQVVHNNENNQTRSTSINSITVYVFH